MLTANVVVLGAVIGFVAISSHGNATSTSVQSISAHSNGAVVSPVDRLTSYDIAANLAKAVALPEKIAINNQAQSARVALAISSNDTNVIAKPQIVATALKSRKDIQAYTAASGDTVASIAQKFGVTSDSIRWSNNLSTNSVTVGTKLAVPPTGVNGIVYTVQSGDTVQSLATKYKANVDLITKYNDAEIAGLKVGEQVIIPDGQIQVIATPARSISLIGSSFGLGSFTAAYGGNGYDYGYCTWYVATQVSVPTNWGNANTWAYYAGLSGWTVSSTPIVGAVAQTSRGYEGHVGYVIAVSPDGAQIQVRDMNNYGDGGGLGRVGQTGWISASTYEHFIYH